MSEGYTWRDVRNDGPSRLPGPDHLGWWIGVALLVAIVLHVAAFFALARIKIALGFDEAEEIRTAAINLDQVEIMPAPMDDIEPTPEESAPIDTASLLEEVDVLANLPEDTELDITPETVDPEFAIKPQQPLADGAPEAIEFDPAEDFDLDTELPELGKTAAPLPLAAEGQVVVDPGEVDVNDPSLDSFTEEILNKGAGGTAEGGTLDGVVTLDDLVGLPENVLVGKKTMLPSDLLFEYDSADLRESARVGLMKLALLIERNPGLYCWIEGHSDLYGGGLYNLELSRKRAASVKDYLTKSLRLPEDRIHTRGYGKTRAIVAGGTVDEQSPNRRVEIKMRRTLPPNDEPVIVEEAPKPVTPPKPAPEPPKAILVKPMRKIPAEQMIEEEQVPKAVPIEEEVPRAVPVDETQENAPKALPVEEEPPKAVPVEEDPPRAIPVGE
ncbi:OmpA family protein [Haloferula chungangensis]|uniref:OmpA family protein n=1 Tax=Haloferula chungangensis TaxID=1048331 RepID=A0ABW2L8N5_9BACT